MNIWEDVGWEAHRARPPKNKIKEHRMEYAMMNHRKEQGDGKKENMRQGGMKTRRKRGIVARSYIQYEEAKQERPKCSGEMPQQAKT
jgi:hypothetical protein